MKLFEPLQIRGLTLPNRIVMAPMGMQFGLETSRARAFYGARARGGVGTILTAATSPNLFASDDIWGRPGGRKEYIESLRPLVQEVHEAGAKIGVQLLHSSRWPDLGPGSMDGEPIGPSARIEGDHPTLAGILMPGDKVREVTLEEIEIMILRHAQGAVGVREAGFDFVELHLSHNYFPCQFFSSFYNRRKDQYGGDLEGRMRFGLDCAKAMRKALGNDFPLFCRLGVEDRIPGSINLADSLVFAEELVKAGVDVLDIDPAESVPFCTPGCVSPMGTFAHWAEAVKQRVDVPVITVGRINKAEVAENILNKGQADLVAIGRQLIADPNWPKKVKEGRTEDIVPCLSCNLCTAAQKHHCSVNASSTWEEDFAITPTQEPKSVWVIGGGPGGMEAARVAALRGHKVALFEKGKELGGKLPIAAALTEKDVINNLTRYMSRQVAKAGVEIRLNSEMTADAVIKGNPDIVVVATGSNPLIPKIPGMEQGNVVLADDVLAGWKETGDNVIVIGGELVGCDTALFLAEQGKRVTIVEILPGIATATFFFLRPPLLEELAIRGITCYTGVKEEMISQKGMEIVDCMGEKRFIEADTIVMAVGAKSNNSLARELEGKVRALHSVGDCVEPRRIREAISEGARVGLDI